MSKEEAFALTVSTHLLLLDYEVRDDTVARVINDIAGLIRKSEEFFEKEVIRYGDEAADIYADEGDYVEGLIGASFVLLQAKIRRVVSWAIAMREALTRFGLDLTEFDGQAKVLRLGGDYKDTGYSLVELVWHLGNFYKHRDQWSKETWDKPDNRTEKTIRAIAKVGIGQHEKLRDAMIFFGLDASSRCGDLAEQVQNWAACVDKHAQGQAPFDPETHPRVRMANELRRR
ncbi:MAG TPA: hypothetical protein VGI36_06600, partial [Candidatus Binataceae bacterium]